ncbi:hypothetical protein [Methylocaldum gracile]|jgi:hypothetical protein|uniref:hypothetical protein n=1 Tax=unclassified Methylocaldum TaxID=2622260 RepID=UPI001060A8C8
MKERVVMFDKTTGAPVASIQSPDPTFILLNCDDRHHVSKEVPSGMDWQNLSLNLSVGHIEQKIPAREMFSSLPANMVRVGSEAGVPPKGAR